MMISSSPIYVSPFTSSIIPNNHNNNIPFFGKNGDQQSILSSTSKLAATTSLSALSSSSLSSSLLPPVSFFRGSTSPTTTTTTALFAKKKKKKIGGGGGAGGDLDELDRLYGGGGSDSGGGDDDATTTAASATLDDTAEEENNNDTTNSKKKKKKKNNKKLSSNTDFDELENNLVDLTTAAAAPSTTTTTTTTTAMFDDEIDTTLSAKERADLEKKRKKEEKRRKKEGEKLLKDLKYEETKNLNKKKREASGLYSNNNENTETTTTSEDDGVVEDKKESKKKKKKKKGGKKQESMDDDDDTTFAADTEEEEEEVVEIIEEPKRKTRRIVDNALSSSQQSQPNYVSLSLKNVGVIHRDQTIIANATWGVSTGERVGLVGRNGAGKTTQLKILNNEMEPDVGNVIASKNGLRVSTLRQEFVDDLVMTRTLTEELMSGFIDEIKVMNDLEECENKLANVNVDDAAADPSIMQDLLDDMNDLRAKYDVLDVSTLETRIVKVADLMGFTELERSATVSTFSGGWKMRIGLGKVLLQEPNVMLLDEPTNHLDLESVEWLERFLIEGGGSKIPCVIVSHDREFLDRVCNKIVDAEGGICSEYDGNYSRFLELKKARIDTWTNAYNAQEKKIKEERKWIQKFKVKQPQAVKQRKARLDKLMASSEYIQKPPFNGKAFHFRFPDAPRISPEVADIKELCHSYVSSDGTGKNHLFDNCNLFVEKNDRIAVVGPNGSGKSTLLRLLTGKEKPDEGYAGIVGSNVLLDYFEQNQADVLDLKLSVMETVQGNSNGQSYEELRALLGKFLFRGDAVDKKVLSLSGGEKARLSLCCMMLRPSNFLVLDEPTNHLDIPAKEMLEEALQQFQGTVMIVSHDRYFVSKVARTIVAVEDKKLVKYQGDYKFFMDQSDNIKQKVEARAVKGVERIGSAPVIDLDEIIKTKTKFGGNKNAGLVKKKDKGVKNAKRNKK